MKGIIFNYLEEFLINHIGEEAADELISSCPLQIKGPFVGPGSYPDSDFFMIVKAASQQLNMPLPILVKAFGKFSFPKLGSSFPQFLEGFHHPKPFLMTVDSIIHVEVYKLLKDSVLPRFSFEDISPNQLGVSYYSQRKICPFLEGLLDGTSEHFGVPIHYDKLTCMNLGAPACQYTLTFSDGDHAST